MKHVAVKRVAVKRVAVKRVAVKRVAIFGSPGSGKSTLARQLSARSGLPVIHLDQYFFLPGWVIKPTEPFEQAIAEVVANDCWITDGNYIRESIQTGRIDRADTLILLECPRLICLLRVLRRVIRNYGQVRPDQAPGCPERFDWKFVRFVWNYPEKTRQIRHLLTHQSADKTVWVLRGTRAVKHFLNTIPSAL